MPLDDDRIVSATVILLVGGEPSEVLEGEPLGEGEASGEDEAGGLGDAPMPEDSDAPLAAANPTLAAATVATQALQEAGFEAAPVEGERFVITARADAFESFFGVELREDRAGDVAVVRPEGGLTRELPAESLPRELHGAVRAVSFEEPALFDSSGDDRSFV